MKRRHIQAILMGLRLAVVLGSVLLFANAAKSGGGPENALLIIDPRSAEAVYVGNYYRNIRNVPDRNVIYMDPSASDYESHAEVQLDALFGMLTNLGVDDHIDYIIIPPGSSFFVSAEGLVTDACSAVTRFSISSVYTMAFLADEILESAQTTPVSTQLRNEYYTEYNIAKAFDGNTMWYNGNTWPPEMSLARRYFIGALLGYDGALGNTIEETIAMIDRSVMVDGSRPAGTFYFMETSDELRSGPRDVEFSAAVDAIEDIGGQAEHLLGVLPLDHHDCLGIMTGWASPEIDSPDMTILSGAFCDHLTSYAGQFDISSQAKLSRWIAEGASGSYGTVQEPCNYPGKFPDPRMHVFYAQGASLGEAVLRSLEYVPFQGLTYGDPLTRPFAYLPDVEVADAPSGEISGNLVLTPTATTPNPEAGISGFDLYVDGILLAAAEVDSSFVVDTTEWPDGTHDVRIVAYEDSSVASQGRWIGSVRTNNHGRSATLGVDQADGELGTLFTIDVSASGAEVTEIRLISGARVLASSPYAAGSLKLLGKDLGPGPVRLHAEAEFDDGLLALSDVVVVDVQPSGEPQAHSDPPVAFSYRKHVPRNVPIIVELPASNLDGTPLSYTVGELPAQGVLVGSGPTRLLRPDPGAAGEDAITFVVEDEDSTSSVATISIRYEYVLLGDLDLDRDTDLADLSLFQRCFSGSDNPPASACPGEVDADIDGDGGDVDLDDLAAFIDNITGPW